MRNPPPWPRDRAEWLELRGILCAGAPLVAINLAHTGMQFIDAWMVSLLQHPDGSHPGLLGEQSLAAILPSGMMFLIPLSFGWGVMASLNTFVAQSLGRQDFFGCGHYTLQGLTMAFVYGLAMLALWPLAPGIFACLGHEPAVQQMEVGYFQINLLGAIPALMISCLSSFFTGLQRTLVLFMSALCGTALNIFANWLFIYGNWGCPRLEIQGSALGTVLAEIGQVVFLLGYFWSRSYRKVYGTSRWKVDFAAMGRALKIGAPAGGQFVFDLFTWGVIILWMIGLFGTAHMAANTIVIRYLHLAFMPALAVGNILTARVGHSIGAKNWDLAVRQTQLTFAVVVLYMSLVGFVFVLGREPLLRFFTDNDEIVQAGGWMMIAAALYQVFDAMYITYSHALRGAGDTLWPALALIIYSVVVLVGGGWAMITWLPELKSLGPWLATTLYVVFLGVTMKIRWNQGRWRHVNIFVHPTASAA